MMIAALKTSGAFLAVPGALALFGWPQMAFGWLVALQFPPYLLAMAISAVLLMVAGFSKLGPVSFLAFGTVSAVIVLLMVLWSMPSEFASLPLHFAQGALIASSTFVPFAVIQFLLALFVRPFAPST